MIPRVPCLLMERDIVQHNNRIWRRFRQQALHSPSMKHIGAAVHFKQAVDDLLSSGKFSFSTSHLFLGVPARETPMPEGYRASSLMLPAVSDRCSN